MRDIFGNEVTIEEARALNKRKATIPKGYAALPGTGPAGETCNTCRHIYRRHMSKTYTKCGLMKAYWTGGAATDIKARSPACRNWQPAIQGRGDG